MDDFEEVDTLLNGLTEKIVEQKVLSTEAGKITATGMMIGTEYRKVIALGLGKADSLEQPAGQELFGKLFQYLKDTDTRRGQLLPGTIPYDNALLSEALGLMSVISVCALQSYSADRDGSRSDDAELAITGRPGVKEAVERGEALGRGVAMARSFRDPPPNIMTPAHMADKVAEIFGDPK